MPRKTIAIVGGGFCGVVTAVQLLRCSSEAIGQIVLIEKRPLIGRGVAYGTTDAQHLLNVPAGRMSALVHDDENFVRFLRQVDPTYTAESFASRMTYGRYLESMLNDAIRQRAAHTSFRVIHDTVFDIKISSEDRAALIFQHGPTLLANVVVIANGNLAIRLPMISAGIHNSSRYISDPWATDTLSRIDPLQDTLLLGAGLTAVDIACSLTKMTYRPLIHMVSRHGLQAQRFHAANATSQTTTQIDIPLHRFRTVRKAVKAVRQQIQTRTEQGHDWRDVFTALRSKTATIWQSLPQRERSTFLRHVQPYWDIHRHRVSP